MSVQFGRWNFEGQPPTPEYIEKVSATLAPYGPDSDESYSNGGIRILYRAFHTTKESRRETQPHISSSGAVITWDGRLDNRTELISELHDSVTNDSTDVAIVAMAFEKWGADCFARLIGDWAVSIWNPANRSLMLAKDPIGTRHLYYSIEKGHISWSTVLVPIVLFAEKTFSLSEEYIAGWFSMFPAAHLTPYVGVHSVPPSSFVLLRPGRHIVNKYWDFDPDKRIHYRTDAEYEEHFRTVFATAIQRSLRSDSPILGELSGGRDSSSIVCMADTVIARGAPTAPRLDTISYYDDSEPNWNERPYFTKVEEKRGRIGCHIDVNCQSALTFDPESGDFAPTPSSVKHVDLIGKQFAECMTSQGNRVVVSGVGGDEVMGGVPTPGPELQDLFATAQFRRLAKQVKVWAIEKRKPWFHLLFAAVRGFLPSALVGVPTNMQPPPWLCSTFVERHREALTGYPSRIRLCKTLPSFQENISTLKVLQRQLAAKALRVEPCCEKRYPFLDRGLLEFVFAIPRTQLVRPTQRRSLMRRALVGIVPTEILNRKGKAFVARAPLVAISSGWARLIETTTGMVSSALGIVDSECLLVVLRKGQLRETVSTIALMRTILVEAWLRSLRTAGIMNLKANT